MKDRKGFTLIELIVVVGLIALFASIVLVNLGGSRQKSRDVARAQDLNQIAKALQLYATSNGVFPDTLADLAAGNFYDGTGVDPLGVAYEYVPLGSSGCSGYHLGAVMEEAGSKYLASDSDAAASGSICTAAADFEGASTACTSSSGADMCYDLKQ